MLLLFTVRTNRTSHQITTLFYFLFIYIYYVHYFYSSRSGRLVATGGTAGILRVWDFETSRLIGAHAGHTGTIMSLAFSPDDKQIITVSSDGSITLHCVFSAADDNK